jgi:hypothetical protein
VLGYHQSFDVEGDSGIVARTYGTCVLLERRGVMKPSMDGTSTAVTTDSERESTRRALFYSSGEQSPKASDQKRSSQDQLTSRKVTFYVSEAAAAAARHREGRQDEVQMLTIREFAPTVIACVYLLFITAQSVSLFINHNVCLCFFLRSVFVLEVLSRLVV